MSKTNKQSFYIPAEEMKQIRSEALRLDRSASWVLQRAWKIAKAEIATMPTVSNPPGAA